MSKFFFFSFRSQQAFDAFTNSEGAACIALRNSSMVAQTLNMRYVSKQKLNNLLRSLFPAASYEMEVNPCDKAMQDWKLTS